MRNDERKPALYAAPLIFDAFDQDFIQSGSKLPAFDCQTRVTLYKTSSGARSSPLALCFGAPLLRALISMQFSVMLLAIAAYWRNWNWKSPANSAAELAAESCCCYCCRCSTRFLPVKLLRQWQNQASSRNGHRHFGAM